LLLALLTGVGGCTRGDGVAKTREMITKTSPIHLILDEVRRVAHRDFASTTIGIVQNAKRRTGLFLRVTSSCAIPL